MDKLILGVTKLNAEDRLIAMHRLRFGEPILDDRAIYALLNSLGALDKQCGAWVSSVLLREGKRLAEPVAKILKAQDDHLISVVVCEIVCKWPRQWVRLVRSELLALARNSDNRELGGATLVCVEIALDSGLLSEDEAHAFVTRFIESEQGRRYRSEGLEIVAALDLP